MRRSAAARKWRRSEAARADLATSMTGIVLRQSVRPCAIIENDRQNVAIAGWVARGSFMTSERRTRRTAAAGRIGLVTLAPATSSNQAFSLRIAASRASG